MGDLRQGTVGPPDGGFAQCSGPIRFCNEAAVRKTGKSFTDATREKSDQNVSRETFLSDSGRKSYKPETAFALHCVRWREKTVFCGKHPGTNGKAEVRTL
jgi:hypothetical protein